MSANCVFLLDSKIIFYEECVSERDDNSEYLTADEVTACLKLLDGANG